MTLTCLLCGTARPAVDMTSADDAVGESLYPVCRADAPMPVKCFIVRELKDRWATALRLGTKLYLEREDVQAMRSLLVKEGWVAA
jgi:hypothetical protein